MSVRSTASPDCKRWKRCATRTIFFSAWAIASSPALAGTTNFVATPLTAPSLPEASFSVVRVFGALVLVIGVFLGGVWLFRNWQRVAQRGRSPKLNLLESRSLGSRHTLHVVGYHQERFLIAASPNGVNLVSHLPAADEEPSADETSSGQKLSFAQAFTQ